LKLSPEEKRSSSPCDPKKGKGKVNEGGGGIGEAVGRGRKGNSRLGR